MRAMIEWRPVLNRWAPDEWVPACNRQETPFTFEGTRWLYVWNAARSQHGYLNLDTDTVHADYRSTT